MEQSIENILSAIDEAIVKFQDKVPGIQRLIHEELQPLIKEFDISNGRILNNLKNLKLIGTLRNKLEKIIINADYKKSVSKFIESFGAVSNLNNEYFSQFNKEFKPKNTLPIIKQLAVESTINNLVGQGMNAAVIDPVISILNQNITTGGVYTDFQEQIRNHILTNDTGEGNLERYTKQITTDAIHQYNAQYQETIAQDLEFNWGRYIGSNITTSRQFCVLLTEKQWVHKTEIPEIIKGHIGTEECKLSKTTKLPLGMIPGTTPDNFKIRRGGYNCGHQFFWVPDSAVPEDVKRNFKNKGVAVIIKPVSGESQKTIDLKAVKKIKDVKSIESLLLENKNALDPFFHNTAFKSLKLTRVIGRNAATDMNGNISVSSAKANHLVDGFNNMRNNVDLSEDQEKAFATLWHEIWHNTNKANSAGRLTVGEIRYMELGNEFVARKTLDDVFGLFGSKLKDQTLKVNRNDTLYNPWVRNYDKLIAYFKADETIVLDHMKGRMRNGDYTDVKTYLQEAIIKGVRFSKLKVADVKRGVQDAVNLTESEFNEKYK